MKEDGDRLTLLVSTGGPKEFYLRGKAYGEGAFVYEFAKVSPVDHS